MDNDNDLEPKEFLKKLGKDSLRLGMMGIILLLIIVISSITVTSYTNTTGLIGLWSLENNTLDYTGVHNGTYVGSYSNVTGKIGYGIGWDGTSDYINVTKTSAMNVTSITVGALVNTSSINTAQEIMSIFRSSDSKRTIRFEYAGATASSRKIIFQTSVDGTNGCTANSYLNPVNVSGWYLIVATFDPLQNNGYSKIFINGVDMTNASDTTNTSPGLYYSPDVALRIGGYEATPTRTWNGSMDEVFMFNRALSATEVSQMYNDSLLGIRISDEEPEEVVNVSISSVSATALSGSVIRLTWTTNIPTNASVKYGTTTAMTSTRNNNTYSTSHTEYFTGLNQSTTYYFNITSYNSTSLYNSTGTYSATTTQTMFYVDCEAGNDGNSGNISSPLKTITRANTLASGTSTVLFKGGTTCRTPTQGYPSVESGTITNFNTWTSYGTGQAKIYASKLSNSTSEWTNVSTGNTNLWRYTLANSTAGDGNEISQIYYYDGSEWINLHRRWSISSTISNGQGNYYSNTTSGNNYVYIYSVGNPVTIYGALELPVNLAQFKYYGLDYVNISNLELGFTGYHAIEIQGASNNALYSFIYNNTIHHIGGGSWGTDASPARWGNGIQLWGSVYHSYVAYNTISDVWDAALTIQANSDGTRATNANNNSFVYNLIYRATYGFEIFNNDVDGQYSNINVSHNTFAYNGYLESSMHQQRDETIETVYGRCLRAGSDYDLTNFTFQDNICGEAVQYVLGMSNYLIHNDSTNLKFNNNIYYKDTTRIEGWDGETTNLFRWVNSTGTAKYFTSFTTYRTETGLDTNTIFANPVLATNYEPASNSPACGNASDGGDIGALPCAPPNLDVIPPIVTPNSPLNTFSTSRDIVFNCSFTDELLLSNASLWLNNTHINTVNISTNSTVTWTINNLSNGNYTWICGATDNYSNSANSSTYWVYVNYDNELPNVNLNNPIDDEIINTYQVTFNWTATDENLDNISLYLNNELYYTNTTPNNGTYMTLTSIISSGSYTWLIEACDTNNNCANSTPASFISNYDDQTPTITPITPINLTTGNNNITFTCTATDNINVASINLYLNGALNYSETTNNETLNTTLYNISNGNYTWSCTASDSNGNTESTGDLWVNVYYTSNLTIDKVYEKITGNEITDYELGISNTSIQIGNIYNNDTDVTSGSGDYSYVLKDVYTASTYALVNYIGVTGSETGALIGYVKAQITYSNNTIVNSTAIEFTEVTEETKYIYPDSNAFITNIKIYYNGSGSTTLKIWNVSINGAGNFSTTTTYTETNQSQDLSSGTYYFYPISSTNNYLGTPYSYTFADLGTETINVTGLYNATLNIGVKDTVTNAVVTSFNGNITYGTYTETFNTTNGTASINLITGLNYPTYVSSTGYTTTVNYANINSNSTNQYYNFSLYSTTTLIINTKNMYDNTYIDGVSVNLTGNTNYVLLVNNTSIFNVNQGNYNAIIGKAGYTTINDYFTHGTSTLTNKTYYLTNNGLSVTFYVKNIYGQFMTGAQVNVSRASDGALIGSKLSDSAGAATFILDTNLNYLVTATLSGYNSYSGNIEPTTDTFILTLGSNVTEIDPDYYTGFTATFSPSSSNDITNNTNEQFNFTYNSTNWNVSYCYITIGNTSTSLNTTTYTTCDSDYGFASLYLYTGNQTFLDIIATLTINDDGYYTNITFSKKYSINTFYEGEYSLFHAVRHFKEFDKAGFDQSNHLFIVFIIIFSITLTAARQRINEYTNSANLLLLLALLVGVASYLELLNLPFLAGSGTISIFMERWGISVLVTVLAVITYIINGNEER
jgi:hypothetical protein